MTATRFWNYSFGFPAGGLGWGEERDKKVWMLTHWTQRSWRCFPTSVIEWFYVNMLYYVNFRSPETFYSFFFFFPVHRMKIKFSIFLQSNIKRKLTCRPHGKSKLPHRVKHLETLGTAYSSDLPAFKEMCSCDRKWWLTPLTGIS